LSKSEVLHYFMSCILIKSQTKLLVSGYNLSHWSQQKIKWPTVRAVIFLQTYLDNVRSSLCCLSVVTGAWLCNYVAVSDGELRQKALQILHQLQTPPSTTSASSESSLQYYNERSLVFLVFHAPRTGQGPCHANLHKWGLGQSPSCDCGQRQTMNHVVDICPLTEFVDGLNLLHKTDDDAVIWLESTATAALTK